MNVQVITQGSPHKVSGLGSINAEEALKVYEQEMYLIKQVVIPVHVW